MKSLFGFSSESVDEIPNRKLEQNLIQEFKEICKSKVEICQEEIENTKIIIEYDDFCKTGQKYVILGLQNIYNFKLKEIIDCLNRMNEKIKFKKVYFTFLLENKIKNENGYKITVMNEILKIEQNINDYSKSLIDLEIRIKSFFI